MDYKDFSRGDSKQPSSDAYHPRWWECTGKEAANAIAQAVATLQRNQANRIRNLRSCAALYGDLSLAGVSGLSWTKLDDPAGGERSERLTDNVTQSIVDTATARIANNRPRALFLTDGGDWALQQRAKKLTKFVDGVFYDTSAYALGREAQRDAHVFGDGILHAYEHPQTKRICIERVLAMELWVDEMEAAYGFPRQMHWERPVDRMVLCDFFPDQKDVIMRAESTKLRDATGAGHVADMITVRESWHLRSGPDAKDGKHTISIDEELLDPLTEWPYDFFPFVRFRWCPRPIGYWSQGICEQLKKKQKFLNRLDYLIQRSFHLASSFKVYLEAGSKIAKEHVNNEIGTVLTYVGQPPIFYLPQVVPPEYYAHRERIVQSMYDRVGVNQMVATGEKPAGLNSGEAQRVYKDTTTERLKTAEDYNEEAFMDLAKLCVHIAREIAQRDGAYEVQTPTKRRLESVRLTAKELNPTDWKLQCFPTSSLPKDPAGRTQTVTEWIQAGWIDADTGRELMQFPDLDAANSLAEASDEIITKKLDAICDGDDAEPWPTDDLQKSMRRVLEYIARGQICDIPPETMNRLFAYKSQLETLLQASMPPPAPPQTQPGQPPQAVPEAPPTSPLLPVGSAAA